MHKNKGKNNFEVLICIRLVGTIYHDKNIFDSFNATRFKSNEKYETTSALKKKTLGLTENYEFLIFFFHFLVIQRFVKSTSLSSAYFP